MSVLKLPPAAIGTVFASRVLPGDAKVLWEKHVYLDRNPEGCRMSAANMALLTGRSPESVENYRRRFVRLGLLYKTGTTNTASWYVTFPADCRLPAGKPVAAVYAQAAAELDNHFRSCGGWNGDELPDRDTGALPNVGTGVGVVSSLASVVEGGRGVAPQSSSLQKGSPQSAISDGGVIHSGSGNCDGGTENVAMQTALAELRTRLA